MVNRKRGKSITKKEFDTIKKLAEMDISNTKIADFIKRSSTTVSSIRKFNTLEEYNQYNRERLAKSNKIKATEEKPEAESVLTSELQEIKKILVAIHIELKLYREKKIVLN